VDGWITNYGVLVFMFGAALVLFGRAGAKRDEMAAYVAHGITGLAGLIAIFIGLSYGPRVLWAAGVAVFVVNLGFLARRIRQS
jgi:hypothetical protein